MSPINQSYVYVGLGSEGGREGNGLYRRTVGNGAWELTIHGLPQDSDVRVIAIDPTNPAVLYAGVQDGAYRSDDRGDHWERLGLPGDPVMIWSFAFHPQTPQVLYAGGEETSLFRSEDGGKHWELMPINVTYPSVTMTPRELPKRILSLAVDPNRPGEMYAAVEVGGLIRSRDSGATWEGTSDGHYQNDDPVDLHGVLVSSANPRHISIISRIGLYRSDDGGDHWAWGNVERLGPMGTYCRVLRESPNDPSSLYLATGPEFRGDLGVLFHSSNGGESWEKMKLGVVPDSTLFGLAINPRDSSQMYCATRHGQVLGSVDEGATWADYSLPDEVSEVNALVCG